MFISTPYSLNGNARQIAGDYTDILSEDDVAAFHNASPQCVFEQVCDAYSKQIQGIEYQAAIFRAPANPKSFEHLVIAFLEPESEKVELWCGEKASFILAAQKDGGHMEFAIAGIEPKELLLYPDEASKLFTVKFLPQALIEHEFQHGAKLEHNCGGEVDLLSPSKTPLITGLTCAKDVSKLKTPQSVLENTIGLSPRAGKDYVSSLSFGR